jgi:glycosyltransferase involved in cell wall biosynthesis
MSSDGVDPGSPRVSVIITAWNAERHVAAAIDSVLAQTRPAAEVIVNDDGSDDGTAAVVRRYGSTVTLLSSPHRGIAHGRNQAIQRATGDLLAFVDADDLWRPRKLEAQVAMLAATPTADASFCGLDEFVDEGGLHGHRAPRRGVVGPVISTLVIRAETAGRIGPFDPSLEVGDWIDWWGRALEAGVQSADVPEVLADRRLHANNHSVRKASESDQYLRIVRAHLARDRAGS